MSEPFRAEVNAQGQGRYLVHLIGTLGEGSTLPFLPAPQIIELNLERMDYITSFGTKLWQKWVRAHSGCGQWIFRQAQPGVVAHFNLVAGFLPDHSVVESFYAPFVSEQNLETTRTLLVNGIHFGRGKPVQTPKILDTLGTVMVPDFVPTRYFRFLDRLRQ